MSEIALRQEISNARMLANFANFAGGKSGKTTFDPNKFFSYEEFLPSFARPPHILEDMQGANITMTKDTARIVMRLARAGQLGTFVYGLDVVSVAESLLGHEARQV